MTSIKQPDPMTQVQSLATAQSVIDDEWDAAAPEVYTRLRAATDVCDERGVAWRTGLLRRHWRPTAVVTAAAAATVIAVTLPGGTPGSAPSAAASALHTLAGIAAHHSDTVRPGQYSYYEQLDRQTGQADRVSRVWTDTDGDLFVNNSVSGTTCLARYPHTDGGPAHGDYSFASTAELAALPTDPTALAEYIDAHPSGDNRGTTNRLSAAADLLREAGQRAPRALRVAVFTMLADTPGLTADIHATDSAGRTATAITSSAGSARRTLLFSSSTAFLLEDRQSWDGASASTLIRASAITDALPALPRC